MVKNLDIYKLLNRNVINAKLLSYESFANIAAFVEKFIIKDPYAFIFSNNQRKDNGFLREKQGRGKRVKRNLLTVQRLHLQK
jgi:hypothetical protein